MVDGRWQMEESSILLPAACLPKIFYMLESLLNYEIMQVGFFGPFI